MGDHLARIELRLLLTAMLHRFPDLRLAGQPEEIRTFRQRVVYGVAEPPVEFTAWTARTACSPLTSSDPSVSAPQPGLAGQRRITPTASR
ncbi:hypothetical protein [Streptomyces sp. NPDC003863]